MMDQETQQRQAVIAEARTWLLTPHHHGARVKGHGVDCAMFPAEVYEAAGLIPHIELEDYPGPQYHLHRNEEKYLRAVLRFAYEIPGPPKPGDFVLYQFGRVMSHGAIVIVWPTVIHAASGRSVEYADGRQMTSQGHKPLSTTFYRLNGWRAD